MPQTCFLIALVIVAILIPMSLKQRRTLVPLFEDKNRLCDLVEVPGAPSLGLGSLFRGIYYSLILALFHVLPAGIVERTVARFPRAEAPPTKTEFMQHFSQSDIRRALVFTLLAFTFLVLIVLVYFSMPAEAR